jgi:nucleotide-binding universal stress UspA family protein
MEQSQSKPIVVGIDGSQAAIRAALWAVPEAKAHELPLHLVYVMPIETDTSEADVPDAEFDYGMEALEAARQAVVARDDSVKVETKLLHGKLNSALTDLSASADMMVVGSVGVGFFAEMILGSTAASLARDSVCPLAIVRAVHRYADVPTEGPVMTPFSARVQTGAALGAAFREADIRGAELMVVRTGALRAWSLPASSTSIAAATDPDTIARIDEWRQKFPSVAAQSIAIEGYPVAYLEQMSKSAQLIVVNRTRTGESHHLDSIAHAMVYHAKCPVLVV